MRTINLSDEQIQKVREEHRAVVRSMNFLKDIGNYNTRKRYKLSDIEIEEHAFNVTQAVQRDVLALRAAELVMENAPKKIQQQYAALKAEIQEKVKRI